jgi:hypothetical protein
MEWTNAKWYGTIVVIRRTDYGMDKLQDKQWWTTFYTENKRLSSKNSTKVIIIDDRVPLFIAMLTTSPL